MRYATFAHADEERQQRRDSDHDGAACERSEGLGRVQGEGNETQDGVTRRLDVRYGPEPGREPSLFVRRDHSRDHPEQPFVIVGRHRVALACGSDRVPGGERQQQVHGLLGRGSAESRFRDGHHLGADAVNVQHVSGGQAEAIGQCAGQDDLRRTARGVSVRAERSARGETGSQRRDESRRGRQSRDLAA